MTLLLGDLQFALFENLTADLSVIGLAEGLHEVVLLGDLALGDVGEDGFGLENFAEIFFAGRLGNVGSWDWIKITEKLTLHSASSELCWDSMRFQSEFHIASCERQRRLSDESDLLA